MGAAAAPVNDCNFSPGTRAAALAPLVGSLSTSALEGMQWWASALDCTAVPAVEVRGKLTFDTYTGCASGTLARMVTVQGMGHMSPDRSDGLDRTKLLLDFFDGKI
jgi:poly(3-hydroxybutyrate) depolymerase